MEKTPEMEEMSLDLWAVSFSENEPHINHPYLEGYRKRGVQNAEFPKHFRKVGWPFS
jgi:hypothetical protein